MQVPGKKIFYGETFYSDWSDRGGNGFILRGQKVDTQVSTGSMKVRVEVFTKNKDETGDGTSLSTYIDIDSNTAPIENASVYQVLFEPSGSGVKELVRVKISTPSGSAADWMLVRTFPFVWFDGA